jgi:hypothetical protein
MFRTSLCQKHVETEVDNKHLIVASCLVVSLSSHLEGARLESCPEYRLSHYFETQRRYSHVI